MKRLINIINLTIIIFFCFSCKDSNKDEVTSNNLKTEISYSKKGSDKELIPQNDTITANLGDTLNIFVNTNGVNMGLFGNDNLDIQESENGEYICVVKAAGTATVGNLTYTDDSSDYLLVNFYIKVSSKKYTYVIIKDPIFVVNVGNEALQNIIQTELKSASSLNIFNSYKLECKTLQGGNLLYITTAKDTINGTFTSSNILKMNDIAMSYKNSVYNFTLEKATDYNFADGYYLKQDLTERFRVMYPSETINEVSAKALTLKKFY